MKRRKIKNDIDFGLKACIAFKSAVDGRNAGRNIGVGSIFFIYANTNKHTTA